MVADEHAWVGGFVFSCSCLLTFHCPSLYELQSGFSLTQVLTPQPMARNVTRASQSASFIRQTTA